MHRALPAQHLQLLLQLQRLVLQPLVALALLRQFSCQWVGCARRS